MSILIPQASNSSSKHRRPRIRGELQFWEIDSRPSNNFSSSRRLLRSKSNSSSHFTDKMREESSLTLLAKRSKLLLSKLNPLEGVRGEAPEEVITINPKRASLNIDSRARPLETKSRLKSGSRDRSP